MKWPEAKTLAFLFLPGSCIITKDLLKMCMYKHTDSPSVFVLQIYPIWRIRLSESESSITTPGVNKINTFDGTN